MQLLGKVFGYLLGAMGLGSISDILMTFMPMKAVITWMLTILTMFFPWMAPIIGMGKMIM